MDIEEKQAIKMMKFYQEEYRKQIKTLKENGEPEGYGTIIDTIKGRICNIQLVLNLIEKQEAELEKKDKQITGLKEFLEREQLELHDYDDNYDLSCEGKGRMYLVDELLEGYFTNKAENVGE